MRFNRTPLVVLGAFGALACAGAAFGQSASMPLPYLTVLDGDGKTVGAVVSCDFAWFAGGFTGWRDEQRACLYLRIGDDVDRLALDDFGLFAPDMVRFSSPNCTGAVYIQQPSAIYDDFLRQMGQTKVYAVVGPDPTLGTYRMYRIAETGTCDYYPVISYWVAGTCVTDSNTSTSYRVCETEEVSPNPLEGFHGPTTAQPDRKWTIVGGTKITPPSP